MGHHGALLGEAGYVLGLLAEEGFGDEQREIGVLHAGGLEHIVKGPLHLLPYGIAIGFNHHTSPH